MNKIAFALTFAVAATAAVAAPKTTVTHVPTNLDGVRLFSPQSALRNHIAVINVNGAIPADEWPIVSTYAASRLNLNIWTNETAKSLVKVYFLRGEPKEGIVAAPGKWAKVDVAALEKDNPSAVTLRDRRAKLILRAMAFAVGGGAALEPYCSMFYGAQTPKGMDATNIILSPMCYFPMIEILRQIGGQEMVTAGELDE